MSELMIARNEGAARHRQLLTTVCAAALLAVISGARDAHAADSDKGKPTVWIELGGGFSHLETGEDAYLPPFSLATPRPPFAVEPLNEIERAPSSSWTGNGRITFEPRGSDWKFSAGIVYGRSDRDKTANQITPNLSAGRYFSGTQYNAYQLVTTRNSESHLILDFQAGRDVGLGVFGNGSSSVVSVGIRYAQFRSSSQDTIQSKPENIFFSYHRYYGSFSMARKFSGIGPSLAWDASADLVGDSAGQRITADWSINGAVLFGRQRANGSHHTKSVYQRLYYGARYLTGEAHASPSRSKAVAVPNLGGFVGASWRYPNAKITLGYRADFFFGAVDGGIDQRRSKNIGYYGPFAAISIGLGG